MIGALALPAAPSSPRPEVLAPLAAVAWTLEPVPSYERRSLVRDEAALLLDGLLVRVARGLGALEVAIGEGLDALERSGRLVQLGPVAVGDYARDALGIAPRNAHGLIRLARALRDRPLLRAAVRRGDVTRREAETIVPVARGEAEAAWVERARGPETVRELAAAVRAAGAAEPLDDEQGWERIGLELTPGQREKLDLALALAGDVLEQRAAPPWQRLEVLCQEYLAEHPILVTERELDAALPPSILEARLGLEAMKAGLEHESRRWDFLAEPEPFEAPPGPADGAGPVDVGAIDARLRELAAMRDSWDELVGHLAMLVINTGVWRDMMFANPGHYAEERLGMAGRTLEQRAALERRLYSLPALRTAMREKRVSYEQARVVAAHATGATVDALIARAEGLTVLELRRALDDEAAAAEAARAQMCERADRTLWLPVRVDALLSAAIQSARNVAGRWLERGEAVERIADEFLRSWGHAASRPRTPAQRANARDRGRCMFPGCSRPAGQGHHLQFRSRGGSNALANILSLCVGHHVYGVHAGWLRAEGEAPDAVRWTLTAAGETWARGGLARGEGPPHAEPPDADPTPH